jgi:ABC-type phosphate transport system substrate-binding protein
MRANAFQLAFFLLLCLEWPATSFADVAVIVHPDSPVQSMTPRQVSDLYLGRTRSFDLGDQSNTVSASIYEQPADSVVRETFFRTLNGMRISQVNAYWARLRFSGEMLPPSSLGDMRAALDVVARNKNAIAYVDAKMVNRTVKVVLLLKE